MDNTFEKVKDPIVGLWLSTLTYAVEFFVTPNSTDDNPVVIITSPIH